MFTFSTRLQGHTFHLLLEISHILKIAHGNKLVAYECFVEQLFMSLLDLLNQSGQTQTQQHLQGGQYEVDPDNTLLKIVAVSG
ncbi:hypothetical protein QNZ94_003972 [Vibrio parahaemolyticus]|nr:hypothetical protein [Vibrio parahaemolyticus]